MEDNQTRSRTQIKDIPVCNARIIKEVAGITKVSTREVEEIAKFVSGFIASTIKSGKMETVMVPYFGKFMPSAKSINRIKLNNSSPAKQAVIGRKGIHIKKAKDEVI